MSNFIKALFGNYSKRELKRIKPICDMVLMKSWPGKLKFCEAGWLMVKR